MTQVIMRPMRAEDIPQVTQIDRLSFPTPWSTRTYEFELANQGTSHLVVLEMPEHPMDQGRGLRGIFHRFWKTDSPPPVVGHGGFWLIAGEAHISTIAIHPHHRGQGLGELLLAGMLQRAIHLQGEYAVLEVRESNLTAQRLYRKYEYKMVGRRRDYYRDNREDALLMEIRPLDVAYCQRLNQRVEILCQRTPYVDQFTV